MVTHSIRSCRKADTKRGGHPILGKHVLVESRRINIFLIILVLTPYTFQVIQLLIETTIHRTLFGVYFMRIRSLAAVL